MLARAGKSLDEARARVLAMQDLSAVLLVEEVHKGVNVRIVDLQQFAGHLLGPTAHQQPIMDQGDAHVRGTSSVRSRLAALFPCAVPKRPPAPVERGLRARAALVLGKEEVEAQPKDRMIP